MIHRLARRLVLGICLLICAATAAGAHASLVSIDPPDGAVLAAQPSSIALDFNESVSPLVARLTHPDGRSDIVEFAGGGTRLELPLRPNLAQGSYVLSWRVVSGDGHPIAAASVFSIGSASAEMAAPMGDRAVRAGLWSARLLAFVGLGFGVGGVVFVALLGGSRRAANAALALGAIGIVISVGFQGLDVLGEPLAGLVSAETWKAGLVATTYGATAALAFAAILVASVAGRRRILALVSLGLAAAGVAATGHAATAAPQWLMRPAVFLHALALIAWLGALPPLRGMLRRPDPDAVRVLRAFSAIAPAGIAVLLVTGLGLAVVQLGAPDRLATTGYGRVLLAKSGLVAVVLGLAAYNRWRLTRPALAMEDGTARRMRRSIALEVFLLAAVLAVAGLWRFTQPPRAEAAARAMSAPAEARLTEGPLAVTVAVSPGRAGPVRVTLSDLTQDGEPIVPLGVTLELAKPSFGIGPFRREAARGTDGRYRLDGLVLPIGGVWVVTVDVLVSDFETVRLRDLVDIREAERL